jgi:hypothetical protein
MTDQEIQDKLARFLPIRVILRLENNVIEGKTEESFSMGWESAHVCIFWSGDAYSILGTIRMDGVKWALENFKNNKFADFIIDPLADDSPIEIDWSAWLTATRKHAKRNAPFTVKSHGVWQLRALAAEHELRDLKPMHKRILLQRDEAEDKLGKIADILNPDEEEDEQL